MRSGNEGEDILYQWRLRRRLEQAQNNEPTSTFTSASTSAAKVRPLLPSPPSPSLRLPPNVLLDLQNEFDLDVDVSLEEASRRSADPRHASSSSPSSTPHTRARRRGHAESPSARGGHVHPDSPSENESLPSNEERERERSIFVEDVSIQTSLVVVEGEGRSGVSALPPRQSRGEVTTSPPPRRPVQVDEEQRRRSFRRPSSHDVRCSMDSSLTEVTAIQQFDHHHDHDDDDEEEEEEEQREESPLFADEFPSDEILLLLQSKRDELFRQLQ